VTQDFLELEGAMIAMKSFCIKYNSKLAILLGLDLKNDKVTRDMAIYSSEFKQTAIKVS
jgi:hypothetical protein